MISEATEFSFLATQISGSPLLSAQVSNIQPKTSISTTKKKVESKRKFSFEDAIWKLPDAIVPGLTRTFKYRTFTNKTKAIELLANRVSSIYAKYMQGRVEQKEKIFYTWGESTVYLDADQAIAFKKEFRELISKKLTESGYMIIPKKGISSEYDLCKLLEKYVGVRNACIMFPAITCKLILNSTKNQIKFMWSENPGIFG